MTLVRSSYVALLLIVWAAPSLASDAFSVRTIPPERFAKAIGYDFTKIFIDGAFEQDSVLKVQRAIKQVPSGTILFYLNSPGGNLSAGMQIGRLIRHAGGETYVGKYHKPPEGQYDDSKAGICMSACSLAFLGGINRYVDEDSLYGVHRFSKKEQSAEDLDIAQVISATITNYLAEMGASPELFAKMVEAGASEIRILTSKELQDLRVTKSATGEPEWSIEAVEGGMYLRGMQDTFAGFGKLVFMCVKGRVLMQAVYDGGPNAQDIAQFGNYTTLRIDHENYPLPNGKRFMNETYINNVHELPAKFVPQMIAAKQLGYAMQTAKESPTFWGFAIDVGNERDRGLVKNYLNNCLAQ